MEPGDTLGGFGESRLVEVRSSGETQGSQVVPGSKVSVMVVVPVSLGFQKLLRCWWLVMMLIVNRAFLILMVKGMETSVRAG